MEELTARARLVEASEVDPGSVTATVPRDELEAALQADDGPADLVLDIERGDDGGGRRIAVEWDRADLERLLRQAEEQAIVFAFEREPLALALEDADVEGHGLREKALVLTVAAVTAAGAAGAAKAVPDMGEGVTSSGAGTAYTAIESARSAEAAAPEAPLAGFSGVEAARAAEALTPEPATGAMAHGSVEAVRSAETGVGAPDMHLAAYTGGSTGAAEYTALEAARATEPVPTSGDPGGGTFAVEAPSPGETAALAGVAAIAITGAAFMARSRRRLTPSG